MPVARPDAAQWDWVTRVLGVPQPVAVPGAKGEAVAAEALAGDWTAACAAWSKAGAEVGRQMAALKAALLATGDLDYEEVAEHALDGVIGPGPGILDAALDRLAGADAAKLRGSAAAMLQALQRVEAQLEGNPQVAVCEDNPLGIRVTIRASYARAMAPLRRVLAAAQQA